VLQRVAACCGALQCVAVRCDVTLRVILHIVVWVLQCVAVRCSALQCVAVPCSALQCVAVRCGVWQCVAVCCSALELCCDVTIRSSLILICI